VVMVKHNNRNQCQKTMYLFNMSESRPHILTISILAYKNGKKINKKVNLYPAEMWKSRALSECKKFHPVGSYLGWYFDTEMFRVKVDGKWLKHGDYQYSFFTMEQVNSFIGSLTVEALEK